MKCPGCGVLMSMLPPTAILDCNIAIYVCHDSACARFGALTVSWEPHGKGAT